MYAAAPHQEFLRFLRAICRNSAKHLDLLEHRAFEWQRDAAMVLLAHEVEFRPRRFVALKAIEPQKIIYILGAAADHFGAVLVGFEGKELPIVGPRAKSFLLLDHGLIGDQLQHGSFGIFALSGLCDRDGAREIAREIADAGHRP